MKKFFVAFPESVEMFNVITGKFDIKATVYLAAKVSADNTILYSTVKEAENAMQKWNEAYEDIDNSCGFVIMMVNEEVSREGKGLGVWNVPVRSCSRLQVIYSKIESKV
jgi:hypothetical protein